MKLKQLITGGALAATVLTLGSAQAENPNEGVVFCKATIVQESDNVMDNISITLPFTASTSEGEQYTYWNLGSVPAGGVADSWHSEGGPGKFVAHNNGSVGAYVYLTSNGHGDYEKWSEPGQTEAWNVFESYEFNDTSIICPTPSLQKWRSEESGQYYCLAFTRDVMAKMPTWHMLNMFTQTSNLEANDGSSLYWRRGDDFYGEAVYIGSYMGHLEAGDYMPFDVKFWAPRVSYEMTHEEYSGNFSPYRQNVRFTFMVEAAPFPLWEHDIEVQ